MLRDYQQEMYDSIRDSLKHGLNPCAVLPCRSGKSYIMKEIVEKARQIWKGTSFAIDDITCVVAFFNKI